MPDKQGCNIKIGGNCKLVKTNSCPSFIMKARLFERKPKNGG